MMKKLITCTCVLVILGSSGSFTYGNQTNNSAIVREAGQSLQIVTPERIESNTSNNKLVIEFTAPRETRITIFVYYNTSLEKDGENFTLGPDPITVEVGALQRGWAEVDLRRGTNKIEVVAVYKDGERDKLTRIVRVSSMEDVKRSLEDKRERFTTSPILQVISGTSKTQ